MPITFKDGSQRDDVMHIIDKILSEKQAEVEASDWDAVYDYVIDLPETQQSPADRLGKVTELLMTEVDPDLLQHIKTIHGGMFCELDLPSINLPTTIEKIDEYAFYQCGSPVINYAGTEAQWGAIRKDRDWDVISPNRRKVKDEIVVNTSDTPNIYNK